MSKNNPTQAAAPNAAAEKTDSVAKASTPKAASPAAAKSTPSRAAAKTTASKTAASSTVKPAVTKEAEVKKTAKEKPVKPVKEKTPKLKMERDSFTMPKTEYAQFHILKERLNKLGQPAKKSELLRAGIMQLSAMTDAALKAAMAKVPAIKTGRPKKK